MVEGNFNHKPTKIIRRGLQRDSGIVRRRAIDATPVDARLRLIRPVGLPTSATPAQNTEDQEGDEREGRAPISIRSSILGGDHGMDASKMAQGF